MAGRFSIEAVFKAVDKVTRPVSRMQSRVQKATRGINRSLDKMNRKLRSIGKNARGAFGVAGLAGAVALAGVAIGSVITKGAEFEQQLVGAASRFPGQIKKGTAAFEELNDLARELGATTEFTATQAAGGLNFLAKAGFSAQQAMALLPGILDLATAAEIDLARASDIATDSLDAFGLRTGDAAQDAKNFARISDAMAKTINTANVDLEQLFETIKNGAPAARAVGVTLEDFLAFTGVIAGAGLKAEKAGVALKNVFLKLADRKVQKDLRRLGVTIKDNAGEILAFDKIMTGLNEALGDRSGLEKAGIINELFGLRGVTAVTNVLAKGVDAFIEYRGVIMRSAGATKELARLLRDTRQGEINTMNAAIESLTLTFSKANNEGISKMIVGITELTRKIDGYLQNNTPLAKNVGIFLAIAAAALVVGVVFAGIAAAIAFVASSTVAIGAAVVVATAAFLAWLLPLDSILQWFKDFFAADFEGKMRKLGDKMIDIFNPFTGGPAGFIARGVFSGQESEEAAGPAALDGPRGPASRAIDETRQTSEATLTVRDETGRAELEQTGRAPGTGITLEPSGAF
ncbi:MAG: phage tail tape measure protein [Planctomycetota bacterium]